MKVLLSVIIPVYNGHDYITHCLDSVYALPLSEQELEVIVIDDSSTDDTHDLLVEYQHRHPNMIVLHQPTNQRQGAARNRGIEIARGEYLAFVDADDEVVVEGIMNALNAVAMSHADICYFELEFEKSKGEWNQFVMPETCRNTIMSAKEYLNNYYTCWYNAPWRNLYRTEFLQNTGIRFAEGTRWEDCDWTVKVYAQANNVQFVDGVGYRYGYNPLATSKEMTSRAMAERIYAGSRLINFAESVRSELPKLADTLTWEGRYGYVINELRLRNMTKYNLSFVREMYDFLGDNVIALQQYKWPKWVDIMIKHKCLAMALLAALCPIAAVGRKMVNSLRR